MLNDLVVVGLKGGDASDAAAAVAIDLDAGNYGGAWLALVERSRVNELVNNTGAELAREARPWDGERFGDGAGTVELVDGAIVGTHAYRHLTGSRAPREPGPPCGARG